MIPEEVQVLIYNNCSDLTKLLFRSTCRRHRNLPFKCNILLLIDEVLRTLCMTNEILAYLPLTPTIRQTLITNTQSTHAAMLLAVCFNSFKTYLYYKQQYVQAYNTTYYIEQAVYNGKYKFVTESLQYYTTAIIYIAQAEQLSLIATLLQHNIKASNVMPDHVILQL